MFSQNIMLSVCVLCFSVNAALFTFPMMLLISYWLMIDDVITGGRSLILRFLPGPFKTGPLVDASFLSYILLAIVQKVLEGLLKVMAQNDRLTMYFTYHITH